MKCVLSCFFLLVVSMSGQSVREDRGTVAAIGRLRSTLVTLQDAGASRASLSQELADEMTSLAEIGHRPPRPVVASFADELTRELIGRKLNSEQMTAIHQCIVEVVRRVGTSNLNLAKRLQDTLVSSGIDSSKTQLVVRNFIAVGEAVQGPDDSPMAR